MNMSREGQHASQELIQSRAGDKCLLRQPDVPKMKMFENARLESKKAIYQKLSQPANSGGDRP
jgi:hypothetical protein